MLNPILEQIIANEMEKRLNRKPSATECRDAYLDVIDNFEYTDALTDISNILADYIANNYTQCEQCGEYHLNDHIQTIDGPRCSQRVCSNKDCELCAYDSVHFDPHREWGTY